MMIIHDSLCHLCAGVRVALQEAGEQVQREAHRHGATWADADQHQCLQHWQAPRT